ncbi:MAG: transposase [Burkholderiales bacterium]|nr:transposase [Burkholderiales bacterium]
MPSRTGTLTSSPPSAQGQGLLPPAAPQLPEDGKVKNETLGNLSHLPDALIDIIRRSLQGETFVPASQAFEVVRSRAHGGCPVAVSVFEGNTSDSLTFLPAVQRVRERFGLTQVVMVGDRGMVSQKAIDELRGQAGVDWITALKSVSIRSLVE